MNPGIMKPTYLTFIMSIVLVQATAQDKLEFSGTQFWAMTVPDASATSKWYEEIFSLKLMKEISFERGKVRIIGNENLVLEILEISGSKSLTDCFLTADDNHLLKGIFKTGFYVKDIAQAERFFKSKGITIKHEVFEDADMNAKSFVLVDLNGTMIQVLQKGK